MKQQKGGSVASDAVTSLVSADTYTKMNTMFSNDYANKQCGGESKLHKCPTCGGAYRKKKTTKGKKCKRGGGIFDALNNGVSNLAQSAQSALGVKSNFVDSPFRSSPAPALSGVLPRNVGFKDHFANNLTNAAKEIASGNSAAARPAVVSKAAVANAKVGAPSEVKSAFTQAAPPTVNVSKMPSEKFVGNVPTPVIKGGKKVKKVKKHRKMRGGEMKSMSEMMSQNAGTSYSIQNKKGGSKDGLGLSYNAIKTSGLPNGAAVNRDVASSSIPNELLAREQVSAMPLIQKFTAYGTPSDTKQSFSYSSERLTAAPAGGAWKASVKSLLSKAKAAAKAKKSKSSKSASTKKTKRV
jgi:hypothetical protein